MRKRSAPEVDVCFVLEGTYPFIRGGVSTWVHQAISTMPDLTFGIHYIGAQSEALGEPKYEVPSNVKTIQKVFIFDDKSRGLQSWANFRGKDEASLHQAVDLLFEAVSSDGDTDWVKFAQSISLFQKLAGRISFDEFWKHPLTWEYVQNFYRNSFSDESFASFYWNLKFIIKPVWELLRSFGDMPRAHVYHSVSTGYAGFLASVAKHRFDRPFLLSEHGIYVRERINDLLNSEWSPSLDPEFVRPPAGVSPLRQSWIDFFIYLGKFCYHSADHVTSLFERNAQFQCEFGASRDKIEIIPNGIKPSRFEGIEKDRNQLRQQDPNRKTVGFLGRIVSIKDVRTLIRAARFTCDVVPDAEFLLVGPTDEDEEYHEGCKQLIADLSLADNVKLTGPKKLDDALPLFDVMVLSSISEGLPFAVLESFAANIPVVSTDVGACSELIEGSEDDKENPAGIIVPIADASALAQALITVLLDRNLQDQYGANGKQRAYRDYQELDVMKRFQDHYINLAKNTVSLTR